MNRIILLVELVIFLCNNVNFIVVEYKFVNVRRLVLNVHFVHAVLKPLFVSYLLLICCISSFIYHFIHVPILFLYPTFILN